MPKPKVQIAVPEGDDERQQQKAKHQNYRESGDYSENDSETAPLAGTNRSKGSMGGLGNGSMGGMPFSPRETNGRRSFAATLWNTMSDIEKNEFNKKRFLQLTIGIFMGVCVGVQYAFGVISANLKARAGFRQSDMTTITTVGNCLFAFTFPAGVLFDYAGPKPVLICAMLFGCTGFTLLALIFGGVIEPTVPVVAIANGLPNWQAGFLESGTLLPSLFMFPTNQGEVVILQKTFFGLGSTFFSLSFDGFFSASDNYQGYCIYVACLLLCAISIGTLVTRLPTYKRTTRELAAISRMNPHDAERAKQMEEQSFEMHHNPRLSDRRRLNYGVTILLITLVFFTTLSFTKAFIHIETNAIMALTFVAVACIASFAGMLIPKPLPSFFDYEFLPDIHPPEELVDQPEDPKKKKKSSTNNNSLASPLQAGNESGRTVDVTTANGGAVTLALGNSNAESMAEDPRSAGSPSMNGRYTMSGSPTGANNDGRASQFMGMRASVAGGSVIAIPKAVDPLAIPSVTTPFTQSIRHPFLWCFWFCAFSIMGSNFVFVNNVTQIYVALNNGNYVKSTNSLNVALIGIGSALGRICAGFGETLVHRMNAVRRDRQLELLAKSELGMLTPAEEEEFDMTPIYHKWNSSIVMVIPIAPIVVGVMCLCTLFVPAEALGILFVFFAMFVGLFLAVLPLSIREIFTVDVAKHLNFVLSGGMLATILLNRVMFGIWYDEEFDRQKGKNSNDLINSVEYHHHTYGSGSDAMNEVVAPMMGAVAAVSFKAASLDNNNEKEIIVGDAPLVLPIVIAAPLVGDETNVTTSVPPTTMPETTTDFTVITTSDENVTTTTTASPFTPTPTPEPATAECAGVACIRKSMLVLAGINAVACGSASFVFYHWWQIRKRF